MPEEQRTEISHHPEQKIDSDSLRRNLEQYLRENFSPLVLHLPSGVLLRTSNYWSRSANLDSKTNPLNHSELSALQRELKKTENLNEHLSEVIENFADIIFYYIFDFAPPEAILEKNNINTVRLWSSLNRTFSLPEEEEDDDDDLYIPGITPLVRSSIFSALENPGEREAVIQRTLEIRNKLLEEFRESGILVDENIIKQFNEALYTRFAQIPKYYNENVVDDHFSLFFNRLGVAFDFDDTHQRELIGQAMLVLLVEAFDKGRQDRSLWKLESDTLSVLRTARKMFPAILKDQHFPDRLIQTIFSNKPLVLSELTSLIILLDLKDELRSSVNLEVYLREYFQKILSSSIKVQDLANYIESVGSIVEKKDIYKSLGLNQEFTDYFQRGEWSKTVLDITSLQQLYAMSLTFGLEQNELSKIAQPQLDFFLKRATFSPSSQNQFIFLLEHFYQDAKPSEVVKGYAALESICTNFGINQMMDLINFLTVDKIFTQYLLTNIDRPSLLTVKNLELASRLSLTTVEAEVALQHSVDLQDTGEDNYLRMIEAFEAELGEWKDTEFVGKPLRLGGAVFGYPAMFTYMSRSRLSHHDALQNFAEIIEMRELSGLAPRVFFNNILLQVLRDDAQYPEGTAHHHLNALVQSVDLDIEAMLQELAKYDQLPLFQQIGTTKFQSVSSVFESWNNLKRFSKIQELLKQTEVLAELQQLKDQGNDRLYSYIETLAFHPNSKVDIGAVMKFWREPEAFLSEGDKHTPREVHDRKKPSNYTEIPHLDLTAAELVRALAEGDLDRIQSFSPLKLTFDIPLVDGKAYFSISELLRLALGSKQQNIEGRARNVASLFKLLKDFTQENGLDLFKVINGEVTISPEEAEKIKGILYTPKIGIDNPKLLQVRAQIHLKSDPMGVVAGNDTPTCMPFGSGKNTVYTFNLNTGQFTVGLEDNTKRTIAQSVVTKDKDVGVLVPLVVDSLEGGESMSIIQPEKFSGRTYVAGDNIEINPNYQNLCDQILEPVYRYFFQQYTQRFAESEDLATDLVPIGTNYSKGLQHLPHLPNTYLPNAPVSYSDKLGKEVIALNLTQPQDLSAIVIHEQSVHREVSAQNDFQIGIPAIQPLTFKDSLAVSYVEGKAYEDNPTLIQYLHNMENALIAMEINNETKRRPKLSLKYTDNQGIMRGYILAYEGRYASSDYEEQELEKGMPIIYIADLASDKEHSLVGGRLIRGFLERYKQEYLSKGNFIPIFAETKETTSYQILLRHIEKLAAELGLSVTLKELSTYQRGNDVMHPVLIEIEQPQ